MESQHNKEVFTYTYSAKEQTEIKSIRQKYLPVVEDKMEQLRKLDASVNQKGLAVSLTNGILGALIMGIGMCCTMVWKGRWFISGIIIGTVGMLIMLLGYPLHKYVTKKEREKIAPEILKLTDELMK